MTAETATADGADLISCEPLPVWVDSLPLESVRVEADNAAIANGVHRLLYETHADLTQSEVAWNVRTVRRILSREGAEQVAHFLAEFDPSYQRLEVHCIRTWRSGEAIEHARREVFQLFRRETDITRRVLNGRITASLLIPDLRTDDLVETAITLYGINPALGSKYSAWAGFGAFNPWAKTRHRLIRPAGRVVFEKDFNQPPKAEVRIRGENVDSVRELAGQGRRDPEDLAPSWAMESPSVQFSEYESWGEVAELFAPYYVAALPSELEAVVDKIAADHVQPARRAVEWLRFVQRELRYFGLSLGEGGYVPRPLDEIWRTRFGDCKGAVLLYVAGARRLGLDVCPALVSTTHGPLLAQILPSATVFNHCIARLRVGGHSYWLDPAMRAQFGDLDVVAQPFGGWALPITEGVSALEPLNDPGVRHFLDFQEKLELGPKRDSVALYRRVVAYQFWAADELRGRLAVEGTGPYAQEVVKALQATWPEIEQTGDIDVDDDLALNRLTIISRYQIRGAWTKVDKKRLRLVVGDEVFAQQLAPLKPGGSRRNDVYLGWPRKATRNLMIAMPRTWPGRDWNKVRDRAGVRYAERLASEGRVVTYKKEFVSDRLCLPAADVQNYRDVVAQLRQNQLLLSAKERFGRIRSVARARRARPNWLIYLIFLAAWVLLSIIWR